MDISDFKHHSKFKFIIPMYYISALILAIFGPTYCPDIFNFVAISLTLYSGLFGALRQFMTNLIAVFKSSKILQKYKNQQNNKSTIPFASLDHQIYHAFVIPNYKEDIDLLAQTLSILAEHKRATSTYLIFLAMQKHEQKSDLKALQLIETFKDKFKYIDYSIHQVRQFESKGKASNVSWCVEKMGVKLQNLMIQEQQVFLTVMDADSWAPNLYFDQVQQHIRQNYQKRHQCIYQPPQIYSRNPFQTNIIVRTYDDLYSSMFLSNLVGCTGISFSLSNYTLSYSLVKKVGFWDTVEQAIGQDAHIVLKSFFKLNGQVQTIPVFVPWNQVNIVTGNGFIADVKAKFWQIERHARGVCQLNYIICMLMKYKLSFRTLLCSFIFLENLFNPLVSPYFGFYFFLRSQFADQFPDDKYINRYNLFILFNLMTIVSSITSVIFEIFKRRNTSIIYKIQNPSLIRAAELPIVYMVHIFGLTSISFMLASFGNLFSGRQYIVASKKYIKVERQKQPTISFEPNTQQQMRLSQNVEPTQSKQNNQEFKN